MARYRVEWWYADGHGEQFVLADDEEQAVAKFWRRFKEFLPMAYRKAVAHYDGEV